MKTSTGFRGAAKAAFSILCAISAAALQPTAAHAQATNLAPGDNSTVQIDPAGGAVDNWVVDGNNILNSATGGTQWFYSAVGAGTPAPIQNGALSISSTPVTSAAADTASFGTTYTYSGYSLQAVYTLTGGQPLSGTSDLQETIDVKNTQATPLTFHFFQYANFTITGGTVSLSSQLYRGQSLFTLAQISAPGVTLTEYVDGSLNPGANEGEVNPVSIVPITGSPATTGLGSAWLLEWDVTLAANQTFILSKDIDVTGIPPAPEPAQLWLLSLGLAAFGGFRYYRRRPAAN
jgi:hypothetical protein